MSSEKEDREFEKGGNFHFCAGERKDGTARSQPRGYPDKKRGKTPCPCVEKASSATLIALRGEEGGENSSPITQKAPARKKRKEKRLFQNTVRAKRGKEGSSMGRRPGAPACC